LTILKNVSATQVKDYGRCKRFWHFRSIQKIRTPKTEAQQRGINIHEAIEAFLRHGIKPPEGEKVRLFVDVVEKHLAGMKGEVLIEQRIDLETFPGGPPWVGFIDYLRDEHAGEPMLVLDYKTTSDFRYAKTPEELRDDSQLNSYGWWAYQNGHEGPMMLGHLYLLTRTKTPKPLPVYAPTDYETVRGVWERDVETVKEMVEAAKVADVQELEPTPSACGMYGGCPYRSQCGMTALFGVGTKPKKGSATVSFFERMKQQVAQQQKAPQAAPPTNGVVPPDAPPREQPAAPVEAAAPAPAPAPVETAPAAAPASAEAAAPAPVETPPKKKRGRPRKPKNTDTEVAPNPPAAATAAGTPEKMAMPKQGLVLYVGCIPVKGPHREYAMFEDWFSSLTEWIQQDADVVDYRLMGFSESKAALSQAIRARISDVPPVMVVSSLSPNVKDALEALAPYATQIVRSVL
jgi:RecB family exonuclease